MAEHQCTNDQDPLRKARVRLRMSGLTYQAVGELMGYPAKSARQSVGQFLHSTNPTIATLERFAKALGMEVKELL